MLSIIIPAYNAQRTITKCLKSFFPQSYQDFEIIVVNDGSTDATASSVERLASGWSGRITLINQENHGAQAARNRGWREALKYRHSERSEESRANARLTFVRDPSASPQDDYIIFCDADIVLRPDCLEKMVQALEEHPEASYAYSSFKFGWKKFKLWPFDAGRLRKMPYIHTTSLIRASAIYRGSTSGTLPEVEPRVSGPFDESITRLQDWDLWLTMLGQGHTGIWIPKVLFQVISTKGTMSQWLPSFAYKIPKWLGIQPKAVVRYNEAVKRIKEKHNLT